MSFTIHIIIIIIAQFIKLRSFAYEMSEFARISIKKTPVRSGTMSDLDLSSEESEESEESFAMCERDLPEFEEEQEEETRDSSESNERGTEATGDTGNAGDSDSEDLDEHFSDGYTSPDLAGESPVKGINKRMHTAVHTRGPGAGRKKGSTTKM